MKTTRIEIKLLSMALFCGLALSSCATIFSGATTPVVLVNSPSGLTVTENGKNLKIERVQAKVSGNADGSTTTYFASGIELDKKIKHHSLKLEANGKSATVDVKLGAGGKWIIVNMFSGGIIGWGVDAATKKWRVAKNKYIDVMAVLDGTNPMSQGKLKRTMKKQAKG
jgi:hypothetical protein